MKALQIDRKLARFAAAKITSLIAPGKGAAHGPLQCVEVDSPQPPVDDGNWHRLRPRLSGICGSDLSTIEGAASRYFEPIVSFPFIPGHEIVADVIDNDGDGRRVVVVPVLSCATRGINPPCRQCQAGLINRCERIAFGHLSPGLQTGFCADTGGGWGQQMVAHESQLVDVPADMPDEQAVMIEPAACAIHAAAQVAAPDGDAGTVVIIGAGTFGLLTTAALGARRADEGLTMKLVVAARYPQQIGAARVLGADRVIAGSELARAVRSMTGSMAIGDQLTGGAETVIDCVGSSDSLAQALQVVAPGGTILMVGMPNTVSLNLTALWHREVAIRGCYAYERADFDRAIDHAANAGRRGAIKIAFDLREKN